MLDSYVVKYIKDELAQYREPLEVLNGRYGKQEAKLEFILTIMDNIANKYPQYTSECEKQKSSAHKKYYFNSKLY